MVDHTPDGMAVYEVDKADRAFVHDGKVVLKFVGGDGPFAVVMPDVGALETAMHLFRVKPSGLTAAALKTSGLSAGRDPTSGDMILIISLEGGGRIHLVVDADQEKQFYDAPRLPPAIRPARN